MELKTVSAVRAYRPEDLPRLREICLETSSFKKNDEKTTAFLYLMFCDYYALTEPESVFVAVDEDDRAQGYILCAKNFSVYQKQFRARFMPQIKDLGFFYTAIARGELAVHALFARRYPAHLHIDLSASARHQGIGTKLMEALKAHLRAQNCKGLMLSCGAKNQNAVRFYKRNGFQTKLQLFGSCLMTFDFNA